MEQTNSVFYWIFRGNKFLWSFSVRKSAGLKSSIIIFLHTFTQLNLIGNQRQQFCPVRARKRRRRNSGYPYCRQITTRSHLSCRGFSLFIDGKVSGKKDTWSQVSVQLTRRELNPHMASKPGLEPEPTTLVGGESSHRGAILAPQGINWLPSEVVIGV